MAKQIKFLFNGCDNNFAVEAPADITLAQLLKQADRMHIYGWACGIRSLRDSEERYFPKVDVVITYDDIWVMDTEDPVCGIKPKEEDIW